MAFETRIPGPPPQVDSGPATVSADALLGFGLLAGLLGTLVFGVVLGPVAIAYGLAAVVKTRAHAVGHPAQVMGLCVAALGLVDIARFFGG